MKLSFTKMNGAGNDFVLVDNRDLAITLAGTDIAWICDRRHGVGADGFILIEPPPADSSDTDFYMHFFNSDGTVAEMCGNGSRCAAHFAVSLGLGRTTDSRACVRFATDSGDIDATVVESEVSTAMMDARGVRMNIPVAVAPEAEKAHFMIMGTRHALLPVEDATALTGSKIYELGHTLRHHAAFAPEGANVNFISVAPDGRIHIRTYEKGVEAETHACGTGSIAAAVLFERLGRISSGKARVVQRCGEVLEAAFTPTADGATGVVLSGPVDVNFTGLLRIQQKW